MMTPLGGGQRSWPWKEVGMHLFQAIKVPSSTHPGIRSLYQNNALLFHAAQNLALFQLSIVRHHSPPPCAIFLATANSTKWLSRAMLLWPRHYFSLWPDSTTEGFSYRPLEFAVKYDSTRRQSARHRCGARISTN